MFENIASPNTLLLNGTPLQNRHMYEYAMEFG